MEEPIKKKKTNGKRNRAAGHDFERRIAELFRKAGYANVVTSRSESKGRDDQGIDIMNKDELVHGRLPYNVQCKNTTCGVNYARLLESMPKGTGAMNVIFHKFTEVRGASGFHPRGHYAILNMEDFLEMVTRIVELQKPPVNDSTN